MLHGKKKTDLRQYQLLLTLREKQPHNAQSTTKCLLLQIAKKRELRKPFDCLCFCKRFFPERFQRFKHTHQHPEIVIALSLYISTLCTIQHISQHNTVHTFYYVHQCNCTLFIVSAFSVWDIVHTFVAPQTVLQKTLNKKYFSMHSH